MLDIWLFQRKHFDLHKGNRKWVVVSQYGLPVNCRAFCMFSELTSYVQILIANRYRSSTSMIDRPTSSWKRKLFPSVSICEDPDSAAAGDGTLRDVLSTSDSAAIVSKCFDYFVIATFCLYKMSQILGRFENVFPILKHSYMTML